MEIPVVVPGAAERGPLSGGRCGSILFSRRLEALHSLLQDMLNPTELFVFISPELGEQQENLDAPEGRRTSAASGVSDC